MNKPVDLSVTLCPSDVTAFSLKDAPSLIESLLPVQKVSIDVYKEREARQSQTLTTLGSYWKGRKPLVLNRACILASLLPATNSPLKDLEVFEMLMSMDDVSVSKRKGLPRPDEILRSMPMSDYETYFVIEPTDSSIPLTAPFDVRDFRLLHNGRLVTPKVKWREGISEDEKHVLATRLFELSTYRELATDAKRAEEIADTVATHIWPAVNSHLGTNAKSVSELVEQLGIMRFGRRPVVADTFSGSGQIPFAAAQLGCDVIASDLNPVACMLTWGAFNVVGASEERRAALLTKQEELLAKVKSEIDSLRIEQDGAGWRGKVYLYCLEVTCPSSGWKVPVLPTLAVSKDKSVFAKLVPVHSEKRYKIELIENASVAEMRAAERGTYVNGNVVHTVSGVEHINSISSIRGDYSDTINGKRVSKNRLRLWDKADVEFRSTDIYSERLYAIQWILDDGTKRPATQFRSVTAADLEREAQVTKYVKNHLSEWQNEGWIPDTRIESGAETERLYRERGWTHWHHLFNPRQLLLAGLVNKLTCAELKFGLAQMFNMNCRLSRFDNSAGGASATKGAFDNQAVNPLFNYGCRGFAFTTALITPKYKLSTLPVAPRLINAPANEMTESVDVYVTDPPYGDAVKYEEILEFFIAWLRKNPPSEFSNWTWDSRRELAVKGENHDFRLSMVAAYKRMAECMPDNGIQVLMFTHQSGNIWADMANIVWASGLRVTAAWYLVTETDSALRDGSYVKGTILLVLRKRLGAKRTNQTDLAYELEDEVSEQIKRLTGMNDTVTSDSKRAKDGNLFEDADLQMAGYAAALKVLTQYSIIDGKEMAQEALRPRVAGQTSLVESLIDFAVNTANKALVPQGLPESVWHDLGPAERFYLKMLEQESHGLNSLDNYQNFAKAFGVRNWNTLMASERANNAALRSAKEFGRAEMNPTSVLFETLTRGVLYALMDLQAGKDLDDVLKGLEQNLKVGAFYSARSSLVSIARFIAMKVEEKRREEASAARVLADGIENQRL